MLGGVVQGRIGQNGVTCFSLLVLSIFSSRSFPCSRVLSRIDSLVLISCQLMPRSPSRCLCSCSCLETFEACYEFAQVVHKYGLFVQSYSIIQLHLVHASFPSSSIVNIEASIFSKVIFRQTQYTQASSSHRTGTTLLKIRSSNKSEETPYYSTQSTTVPQCQTHHFPVNTLAFHPKKTKSLP